MKKTRPLKIYLGDLTYTTVTLATEAFPLNVGFIASYCKKLFGDDVEITLFKYIDDIDKAVNLKFKKMGLSRMFLHSESLNFISPITKKRTIIKAPMEKSLVNFLEKLD